MEPAYSCARCGRQDVRLYRIYGNFLRRGDVFCNQHIPVARVARAWWVPLIQDEDGTVWGHLAVPPPAWRGWLTRPEAAPLGPRWEAGEWANPEQSPGPPPDGAET